MHVHLLSSALSPHLTEERTVHWSGTDADAPSPALNAHTGGLYGLHPVPAFYREPASERVHSYVLSNTFIELNLGPGTV